MNFNNNNNNNYNNDYYQQQQYSEQLNSSRFLFQQIIQDNQPTQQQIIQRAQQLQIQDLSMARQSLTKQMQVYWRPYSNSKSDIYYINLKQKKAYIDHPVDMETRINYARKYNKVIPKFKSYEIEMISGSLKLIQQQIEKYNYNQMLKTQQSQQNITTQLNIVYEESQQSLTSSKKGYQSNYQKSYLQEQSQQQGYIENLQKQNLINQKHHENKKNIIKLNRKQTVTRFKQIDEIHLQSQKQQSSSQQVQLSPQYESMLLQYQKNLRQQYQKQLLSYKQKKQQNYIKKINIYKDQYKKEYQQYKHKLQQKYQHQIQQKNQSNLIKQINKVINNYKQKVDRYESNLQSQYDIIEQLNQINAKKMEFIQNIQSKMESTIAIKKHNRIIQQTLNVNKILRINQKILELNRQAQKKYNYALNQLLNQLLITKGIINRNDYNNNIVNPLSQMYSNMLKKQFNAIDSVILSSQVNRQIRKRSRSIFNQNKKQINKIFQDEKYKILLDKHDKQNKQNYLNYTNLTQYRQQQQTINYSKTIQDQIQKDKQNIHRYKRNRARIFSQKVQQGQCKNQLHKQQQKIRQLSSTNNKQEYNKNNSVLKIMTINEQRRQCRNDRKSMYLRMMKRII